MNNVTILLFFILLLQLTIIYLLNIKIQHFKTIRSQKKERLFLEKYAGDIKEKCDFNPVKIENGFDTLLECKDHCSSLDNRNKWGGSTCTEQICEQICEGCDKPSMCRWKRLPFKEPELKVPPSCILEHEEGTNKITWAKPECEDNITSYLLVITEKDNHNSSFEVDLPHDIESDFCEHTFDNLKGDVKYNITLYSRNKYGYSPPSENIILHFVAPTIGDAAEARQNESTNDSGDSDTTEDGANLDEENSYISNESNDKIPSLLEILSEDRIRDSQLRDNYNIDIVMNK